MNVKDVEVLGLVSFLVSWIYSAISCWSWKQFLNLDVRLWGLLRDRGFVDETLWVGAVLRQWEELYL